MKSTSWSSGLSVTSGGRGVIGHAGTVLIRSIADRMGLTAGLSEAVARRSFRPVHDRGQVLVDVATLLVDGGESISDMAVLRHQSPVLGPVASAPTTWRTLSHLTPADHRRIATARARVRRHVWAQLPGGVPPSRVAGCDLGDVVVLDVDATIVIAHSEKQDAAPTFKGTYGFHPIGVWCDNTSEMLAATLRPGNSGANTADDHIAVLADAIAQVPGTHRRRLLVRADGAGASKALLSWLNELNQIHRRRVDYSVGFAVNAPVRAAIAAVKPSVWTEATAADGSVRDKAHVVELTGLLDLTGWPPGMRVIVRREKPHPGAQLSLFEEADGWRYQAFATSTTTGGLAFLEARHRAHARVEDRIKDAKDTGLQRFPSRQTDVNTAWLTCVQLAADLVAWLRLLDLHQLPQLRSCAPKALRYRLLHTPEVPQV